MTVMMGKLYTALLAANVPEEKAVAAAEEAASFQNDLAKVKADLLRGEQRSKPSGAWKPGEHPQTAVRHQLKSAGFSPIPVDGKNPNFKQWQTLIDVTSEAIAAWPRTHRGRDNTGILTRNTPTLDADILVEEAAVAVENLARERFEERGYFLVRIGRAPKRAIPFRTDAPFPKITRNLSTPSIKEEQKLEFLGDGEQLVCFGFHPDTRKPYAWHGGSPGKIKHEDLPYITEQEAQAFMDNAVRLLVNEHGYTEAGAQTKKEKGNGQDTGNQDYADWQYLIDNILAGRALHDSLRDLAAAVVASGMDDDAAERLLRSLMQAAAEPHDARWQERFNDIRRAIQSAREKFGQAETAQRGPLPFINMTNWDSVPVPEREWAVPDRYPLRQAALFSGEGAVGKSIVQLHLSVAHVLGRDWLGTMPTPGPALYVDAEDDEKELHRRLAAILDHYHVSFADVVGGGLHLMSLAGQDAVLAAATRSGKIEPTALYRRLFQAVGDLKPKMIGFASSANVYAGNEIDRSQVQQFVSLLTGLAVVADGSVVLISHPSLTGINTDTGLSGSTAWHNSMRARSYMKSIKPEEGQQPDTDLREISFKKNNYGPVSASVVLRYQNGLFLPLPGISTLDQAARDQKADDTFLQLLRRFNDQNRNVSDKTGTSYAPALFAKEDEAKDAKLTSRALAESMRRLFKASKIRLEPYGRPSRQSFRLSITPLAIPQNPIQSSLHRCDALCSGP